MNLWRKNKILKILKLIISNFGNILGFFTIFHFFIGKLITENQTCTCFENNIMKISYFIEPFLPVRANLLYKVDDETPCISSNLSHF